MLHLRIIEERRNNTSLPYRKPIMQDSELGNAYSRIPNDDPEFDEIWETEFPELSKEGVLELLLGENGTIFWIKEKDELKKYTYYIISDSGKTYTRLN